MENEQPYQGTPPRGPSLLEWRVAQLESVKEDAQTQIASIQQDMVSVTKDVKNLTASGLKMDAKLDSIQKYLIGSLCSLALACVLLVVNLLRGK